MPYPMFDRGKLHVKPLKSRKNKVFIEHDHIPIATRPESLSTEVREAISHAAEAIKRARADRRSVMLAFGAHTIKNGLGPVLIRFMEDGWVTHLATNGAGIIHDWEFAFQGASCEDVQANVTKGEFGIWEETGSYLNLALNVGAFEGLGYGESIGALVYNDGVTLPERTALISLVKENLETDPEKAAAAADLLGIVNRFKLESGMRFIPHPFKQYGVQAAAYRLNIPFTGHPMFGHDIIYTHPMNYGAAIGRTAERDFLMFAHNINNLDGGVYLSVGSAVMSPMVFEKSLSMAQNQWILQGKHIDKHQIYVVDLAQSEWDWQKNGEPPSDNPAYYLRYAKTFSRMGGSMQYITADNRDFLLALYHELEHK